MQNKFEYYNKQCKFYRKVSRYISDNNLKSIEIGQNYINVIYDILFGKTMVFKSCGTDEKDDCNNLYGSLYAK